MNRTVLLIIGIAFGVAGSAALFIFTGMNSASNPPVSAEQTAHAENAHSEGEVHIAPEQLEAFGVTFAEAGPAQIRTLLELTGEIRVNENAVAHVVPRIAGVARSISAGLGESVKVGQSLAVLDSRELAQVKSAYLSALERRRIAVKNYSREEKLWRQRVSAEQDFLAAQNELAEAEITVRETEEGLHALGFAEEAVRNLAAQKDQTIARYELIAPISGIVTFRHVTQGELVKDDGAAFIITDLSSVWLELSIYQRDLAAVKLGDEVLVQTGNGGRMNGRISFIDPHIDEQTRTARARVILPNPSGLLRPGQFVTASLATSSMNADIAVPLNAVVLIGEQPTVFVDDGDGLRPRAVTLGSKDRDRVQIVDGLRAGERYVATGSFTIKSELAKESFGEGHSH